MISRISSQALVIFIVAASFYFYDFVLQVSPSVMTQFLMSDFNITAGILGSVMGVYFYSYTAMQIPAGLLLGRYGVKGVSSIAIAVCALGALVFGLAPTDQFIALGRLLMGAGSAFAFLSTLYLIATWMPARYFALFAGFTQMLGSVGAAGGETPLAILIHHVGWRTSMLIFALLGFLLALATFLLVHNDLAHKQSRKHLIDKTPLLHRLWQVLRLPQTWAIGLYSFGAWAPITAFAALWGVPFLESAYGMSYVNAATGIALIWLAMALACPIVGYWSDYLRNRNRLLAWCGGIGVISALILIYCNHIPVFVVYLCLIGFGVAAAGQSLAFAVIQDIQPRATTNAANGFNNMVVVCSGAIFQPLIGHVLDHHWHHGLLVNGARVYSAHAYHIALIMIPAVWLLALLMAKFVIRETHCRRSYPET